MQFKKICSTLLISTAACSLEASNTINIGPVTPYIAIRSQGYDAARELAGWTEHINLDDGDCNYFSFYIAPEYTQTFRSHNIFNSLFGLCSQCTSSCCEPCTTGGSLKVSGSRVANRESTDLLADYFYLPTDFQSTLYFNPHIQNVNLDLNAYWALNSLAEGLFFRLHIPITWTRWNLNFCENIISAGTPTEGSLVNGGYEPGYFSFSAIPSQQLLSSFSSYASGNAPEPFVDPVSAAGTITFLPLNFGQITSCARSLAGVADLQAILGYNVVLHEDYHLGFGVFASVPTGSHPTAQYLFEPVVGNGGSWAFGAHITSHANLWRSCDEDHALSFYLDCNIIHLFNAGQMRTFDWESSDGFYKPLGRYMLAQEMKTTVTDLFIGPNNSASAPNLQFANVFTPIANLSTQRVNVSVSVQGDLAAQLTYTHCGFQCDVGYNYWGRSCEKISRNCKKYCNKKCEPTPIEFTASIWAVKGDASVYGSGTIGGIANMPIPLSATQTSDNLADISGGANFGQFLEGINVRAEADQNPNIDNPQLAWTNASAQPAQQISVPGTALQMFSSDPAGFLTFANFPNCKGTRGGSNKIYANISHNWFNDCASPFIGIGGFAEFGPNNCKDACCFTCCTRDCQDSCCDTHCTINCVSPDCLNAAISQWGVWLKFGLTFY